MGGQLRFGENGHAAVSADALTIKETHARTLIHAYRSRAHLKSNTNPVRERRDHQVPLEHTFYGLSDTDLAAVISYTKNNWSNQTGQLVQPAELQAARK